MVWGCCFCGGLPGLLDGLRVVFLAFREGKTIEPYRAESIKRCVPPLRSHRRPLF